MSRERMTDPGWFARHPVKVAYDLIGCVLMTHRDGGKVVGRIVEAEAYAGPADPASHAARRQLSREVMGGPTGHIYTYISYGVHNMMNIVAHEAGEVGGVLIRAIEPLEGIELMEARRGGVPFANLGKGPGSLGQALAIRPSDIRTNLLTSDEMAIFSGEAEAPIMAGPRIGISRAVHAPWRFFEHASPYVSAHKRGAPVTREEVPLLIPPPGVPIE